jgi:hypothetical protein
LQSSILLQLLAIVSAISFLICLLFFTRLCHFISVIFNVIKVICIDLLQLLQKKKKNKIKNTLFSGPDQVLASNTDTTCEANGRVRIKLDSNEYNKFMPLSIPGFFMKTANLYPDHIALVSAPDIDGKRITYTFQYVSMYNTRKSISNCDTWRQIEMSSPIFHYLN